MPTCRGSPINPEVIGPLRGEHGDQLDEEHERQHERADPGARRQPTALLLDGPRSEIEQHHDEDEEHHDRAGVDDDFERGDEGRAEREKHQRDGQQRDDEIQQPVHRRSSG